MAHITGREIALEALLLITRDGEYSHIALKEVLDKYQYLEKRERAFITRVVNGTLERIPELDYIIDWFSRVKVHKMKPVIREILRSAVYQIKYMDSVPTSAACNEAVKLAVRKGFGNLRGFVNGVLREIGRNMQEVEYPKGGIPYLSVRYSLPEWLVRQWLSEYDADTVIRMGEELLKEKPLAIRCNTGKGTPEELEAQLHREGVAVTREPSVCGAFYIAGYDYLEALPSFRQGKFYVQDISSMKVAGRAEVQAGQYVIDVCAAPGGKALHLAELLNGTGHVEARDLTALKVSLIEENIERSGLANIEAVQQDATVMDESSFGRADVVLADLPCSGLGVLGKKPDLKYKMNVQMQERLVDLQREILATVRHYVKPGGKLIYSTCTIHRAENEGNAAWFASSYPEFALVSQEQMIPGRDAGDGFYIAVFRKENA